MSVELLQRIVIAVDRNKKWIFNGLMLFCNMKVGFGKGLCLAPAENIWGGQMGPVKM